MILEIEKGKQTKTKQNKQNENFENGKKKSYFWYYVMIHNLIMNR